MDERNSISSSEDSSEEEDFDDIWESQIEQKRPKEVSEAEAEAQGSPIDTAEVYSENPVVSEVQTSFPQTDYRSFKIIF